MRLVLVVFGEGRAPWILYFWACEASIRVGLLFVCSGGYAGSYAYVLGGGGPHARGSKRRSAVPEARWAPTGCGEVPPPHPRSCNIGTHQSAKAPVTKQVSGSLRNFYGGKHTI